MSGLSRLLNMLFPHKCPLCGTLTDGNTIRLCGECREKAAAELALPCPICGETAPECACVPTELLDLVTSVHGRRHLCVGFYVPTARDNALSRLIFLLKERPDSSAAHILASLLARELMRTFLAAGENLQEWIFVYPPRSTAKIDRIGFEHAERLACRLARLTGGSCADVFRRRGGQEQKQLTETERLANVRGSLRLAYPKKCRGKKVILLDDVMTSGATMAHCAALLRAAGTEAVFCVSVLKTLPRRTRRADPPNGALWFEQ